MIKLIYQLHGFLGRIRKMLIVHSIITFVIALIFMLMSGYYRHETKDIELMKKSGLIDADYFMQYTVDFTMSDTLSFAKELMKCDGVESVICSNTDESYGMRFAVSSDFMFPADLINEDIFTTIPQVDPDEFPEDDMVYPNFYVIYQDTADDVQRGNVRDKLQSNGYYVPVREVIDNKDKTTLSEIRKELCIPFILVGVAFFTSVVISMLIMNIKMQDIAIYGLCGISRWKLLLVGILSFLIPLLIPCALIYVFVNYYIDIFAFLGVDCSNWNMELGLQEQVKGILIFAVSLLLSGIVQTIFIYKGTPIDVYRSNRE